MKDFPWKKRRQHQQSYMSFVWNLKHKTVQDKNAPHCMIFQNDMMATRPISCISLWGPWRKMQLQSTLQFWEPVTKKKIKINKKMASQTILNFIMGWNSRIHLVLFSWSLLLSFAEGSNHWLFVLQYKTAWWETVWENKDEKGEKNVAVAYMLQRGCRDHFYFLHSAQKQF